MRATIRALGEPGDLGWVVQTHGETYAAEYGWNREFEALVAGIVADFGAGDDPGQAAWVAELDGRRVGCCFCVRGDAETAVLRLLLVTPEARGHRLESSRHHSFGADLTGQVYQRELQDLTAAHPG